MDRPMVDRSAQTIPIDPKQRQAPRGTLAVGIFGASGTTGAELTRLVGEHPGCSLSFATARGAAGASLRSIDPAAPDIPLIHPDKARVEDVDVAFVCLPHGHSAPVVERCSRAGAMTIDLSGDLRLRDPALHQRVYGSERSQALVERSAYGLTELFRPSIARARVVSNPGCYPTCTAIGLFPLAASGLLPETVFIDAKSGVSGAGRQATAATHYCAVADDVRPYKLGRLHRHAPEIEQTLALAGSPASRVVFCPHVVPLERGMLITAAFELRQLTADELHLLYVEHYAHEPFVEVLPLGEPARIRAVARTNRAVVGIHPVSGSRHVVITCAIDNLLKGAAGQALQNMNLMTGLPETLGLAPTPADWSLAHARSAATAEVSG